MPKPSPLSRGNPVLSGVIRRDAIEDMSGAVKNFFNLEAVQLEPGPCRCRIDFIAAGNVFLYREQYPLKTHLSGELLHGRFGLAVPEHGPRLKFSGEEMDECRLASAMTGEEMDVYAQRGLKQFVVLLDHARLLAMAEEVALPDEVKRSLRRGRDTMPLIAKPRAVNNFSQRIGNLLHLASIGELEVDGEYFEDWVYGQALGILDVKDCPSGQPTSAVLVKRATEIMDAQRGPLRILDLCRVLRVSPSTLENSFKAVAGVTPHAFFTRRRLNQARASLLRAGTAGRKVTEIASELGFTELGRFAVRYRQLFGESPSETLRRGSGSTVSLAH